MSQSARDVQLTELRDMISQLNNMVSTQNKTMEAMTAMLAVPQTAQMDGMFTSS